MVVGRTDHDVIELPGRVAPAPDRHDVVVEESDCIQCDNSDPRVSIVDNTGDRPQIVMDAKGSAFLSEAGHPYRMICIREVGIDFDTAKTCAQWFGLFSRYCTIDSEIQGVARRAIAKYVEA